MEQRERLAVLEEKLKERSPEGKKVLLGFDGFIDTVVWPVQKRYDAEHFDRIPTLRDYGQLLIDAAGLSLNVEMVPQQTKLGGNGPILANALMELGAGVTYIGALGKDAVMEPFAGLKDRAHVISISDPGQTDAIEFLDGKIISSKLSALNDVNWENVKNHLSADEIARMLDENEIIAMVNWTLLNYEQTIWEGILEEAVPKMRSTAGKHFFFDLCDPRKKTEEELRSAVGCIEKYAARFDVTLGANYSEAVQIAQMLGADFGRNPDALLLTRWLKRHTVIQNIVVHPVKEACGARAEEEARVAGPFCSSPKLTTGAGDNFNGGYLLGCLLDLTLEESLLLGAANSGFYVRNARSASYPELLRFLEDWKNGNPDRE